MLITTQVNFDSTAVLEPSAGDAAAATNAHCPQAAAVHPFKWTDEQSDALRGFVGEGFSYSQSADKINARFGTDYSRNAAIGRANRIGLACPIRSGGSGPTEKRRRQEKFTRPKQFNTRPAMLSPETLKLRCLEMVPRNLSLLDLEKNDCRYAYGAGPFVFCGHPKIAGSSYCGTHFQLSRTSARPLTEEEQARRRATFIKSTHTNVWEAI
jgi:GcrA cell cycle regulator